MTPPKRERHVETSLCCDRPFVAICITIGLPDSLQIAICIVPQIRNVGGRCRNARESLAVTFSAELLFRFDGSDKVPRHFRNRATLSTNIILHALTNPDTILLENQNPETLDAIVHAFHRLSPPAMNSNIATVCYVRQAIMRDSCVFSDILKYMRISRVRNFLYPDPGTKNCEFSTRRTPFLQIPPQVVP